MSFTLDQTLAPFISETTGMAEDEFDKDTPLYSEGYIDSFALTTIISYIEDEVKIEIPGDDITMENFDTMQRMLDYAKAHASS